jgi:acetyltransferase-like isoleucine patch superfamily enzyme
MSAFDRFLMRVRRGETAGFRRLRSIIRFIIRPRAPRMPALLKPVLRFLYETHYLVIRVWRLLITVCYRHPLFQGRCTSVGHSLSIDGLPFVNGQVEIHIGNEVSLGGNVSISSGRFVDQPKLIIRDRAEIGWNTSLTVNREVIIEEDVRISYDCRISDSDGHPRDAELRAKNAPLNPRDIRAVRICRYAWIGNGSHIMKGVTIGEGAIIGANSVVINDIPPYSLAFGNPADVYFKNYGKPKKTGAADQTV